MTHRFAHALAAVALAIGTIAVPLLVPLPALADSISTLPLAPGARFTARIDGAEFVATWTSASIRTSGGKEILSLAGHIGEGSDGKFVNCSIVDPKVGTIPFGGALMASSGCHYQSGSNVFENGFHFRTGSFTITEIDAKAGTISGSFTMGDARNMAGTRAVASASGSFTKVPTDQTSRLK